KAGSLVLEYGSLTFIDTKILEMAISAFDHEIIEARRKANTKPLKAEVHAAELIVKVLRSVQLPSAFLLTLADGTSIGGEIKESGMEDQISSYHFKYGADALSDIYMIGIKDVAQPTNMLSNESLFGASQQLAQGLNQAFFPSNAYRVTPLALFRQL
ncbi:MAG TPA: hypothetical protein PKY82_23770, partial [Pyrinomonadaceae bacterium]|nr:hypothetical protein [Pyrinomonadaceae bacterium]